MTDTAGAERAPGDASASAGADTAFPARPVLAALALACLSTGALCADIGVPATPAVPGLCVRLIGEIAFALALASLLALGYLSLGRLSRLGRRLGRAFGG